MTPPLWLMTVGGLLMGAGVGAGVEAVHGDRKAEQEHVSRNRWVDSVEHARDSLVALALGREAVAQQDVAVLRQNGKALADTLRWRNATLVDLRHQSDQIQANLTAARTAADSILAYRQLVGAKTKECQTCQVQLVTSQMATDNALAEAAKLDTLRLAAVAGRTQEASLRRLFADSLRMVRTPPARAMFRLPVLGLRLPKPSPTVAFLAGVTVTLLALFAVR